MTTNNQSLMQVKIFGAPYASNGESIGEASDLAEAWQLADGNLTASDLAEAWQLADGNLTAAGQYVEVYDDGERVMKYERNDNGDLDEIEI